MERTSTCLTLSFHILYNISKYFLSHSKTHIHTNTHSSHLGSRNALQLLFLSGAESESSLTLLLLLLLLLCALATMGRGQWPGVSALQSMTVNDTQLLSKKDQTNSLNVSLIHTHTNTFPALVSHQFSLVFYLKWNSEVHTKLNKY